MEGVNRTLWERCVAEWRSLARQIREGRYELPIACIVFNGQNTALVIREVKVVGRDDKLDEMIIEVMEEGREHDPPLRISRTNPVMFKVGKDRNGTGKAILLTTE